VTLFLPLAALALALFLSGVFSGTETGVYSLSRTRVEAEARQGHRSAKLILSLLRHEALLLTTLLVANNVVNQGAALLTEGVLARVGISPSWRELSIAVVLAPPLLLVGELLPKDLFRRRPHALVGWTAPLVAATRLVLAPLVLPFYGVTAFLARAFGWDESELTRVSGREAVIDLLRERDSELQPHVERLARNVLDLRTRRVERVMVPWRRVETLRAALPFAEARARLASTAYSRLPVVDERGEVKGYVHQLEVLGTRADASSLEPHLRPLLALAPDTPLDRALARLRTSGQRAALVGTPARPLGWVTLKDLVEEISGELARW
jgi:CBS domain containing-hemolysin-like protein